LVELKGNFTINIDFGQDLELKNSVFEMLNACSMECPDPQELLDLLNPNSQFGQNLTSTNQGLDLEGF
jgi:hypothetical protein